jgi:hypothetical protein
MLKFLASFRMGRFMATSDPMMEAHSLSQEALAVVNIM